MQRGWKIPALRDWPNAGQPVTTIDPPCGNAAILTGRGFDVVDLDSREAIAAFRAALDTCGAGPKNGADLDDLQSLVAVYHVVKTSRGAHVYCAPTGLRTIAGLRAVVNGVAVACDIRAQGGCVVAAGSVNPIDWFEYRFLGPCGRLCRREIAALPLALVEALREALPAQAAPVVTGDDPPMMEGDRARNDGARPPVMEGAAYALRLRRWIENGSWLNRLRGAGPGDRNQALAACSLNGFAHALADPAAVDDVWTACFDAARAAGLTKSEIAATLKKQLSYARLRYPHGQPLADRPYAR